MSQELTDRLERCYTGIIHDTMRAMGLKDFVLPPELRPLLPGQKLAGPAFTVEGKTGEFDAHETLLGWTGLLSAAKPGHVWVCQPNTNEIALMGELSAETLKNKGVRGCVIDGLSRDTEFMVEMGFRATSSAPGFPRRSTSRSRSARSGSGRATISSPIATASCASPPRSSRKSWRSPRPRSRPRTRSAPRSSPAPTRRKPICNTASSDAFPPSKGGSP